MQTPPVACLLEIYVFNVEEITRKSITEGFKTIHVTGVLPMSVIPESGSDA
jgi:hypothetical protein